MVCVCDLDEGWADLVVGDFADVEDLADVAGYGADSCCLEGGGGGHFEWGVSLVREGEGGCSLVVLVDGCEIVVM